MNTELPKKVKRLFTLWLKLKPAMSLVLCSDRK